MQCGTGCSDCCHVRLTITGVEAEAIRVYAAGLPGPARRNLAEFGPPDRCAALDPGGRCKIYDARPLVCRSHGVPIRLGRGSLPVVQACHRNFQRTAPDPDCVLDQATLSAMLFAIDTEARGAAHGGDPGASGAPAERVDLASLLADLAAF
ncbi:MAG TPA: YkgJ family cysteine cluster protein [Kofleriaceae bacterium]|nr:YkgJ family cysteine cluster protein [Kofleriaceae bacterium]